MKTSKRNFALRAFVMILLLVLLFAGRVTCQSAHHELSVSYGIQSTTELMNNGELLDNFLFIFHIWIINIRNNKHKSNRACFVFMEIHSKIKMGIWRCGWTHERFLR